MYRILSTPNVLLSMISHFFNDDISNIEKIQSAIEESSAPELVPPFAFLGRWIASNMTRRCDPSYEKKFQQAMKLLGLISVKVPPVILLTGIFDLNWGMYQPHFLLYDFYSPINKRIIRLRSYVKPFSIYDHLSMFPSNFLISINPSSISSQFQQTNNIGNNTNLSNSNGNNTNSNINNDSHGLPNMILELESDPAYHKSILLYFKRLLLNHAPLDAFKPLIEHRNSRAILTKAIIEILQDLNSTRNATHEHLVFAFSTIFLYIHAFTLSNEIEGQTLCEFLQSRPFLSPFCVLAFINHIPVNLYLFNLLTPKELSQNLDHSSELKPSQYVMMDLSKNKSLSPFVEKMPTILSNYFLSSNLSSGDTDSINKTDDNDFLSFIHLSSATLYNKMKAVLSVARERPLGPLHVSAMGILLLRCITFSLQRTLGDCAETKMFTENFCSFVKTVFAILSVGFSEQLGLKFFDATQNQPRLSDLTLRGAIAHLLPVLLHHQVNDQLIPFCINVAKDNESMRSAHLMITKLLQCGHCTISHKIIEHLAETTDQLILLEYIDTIPTIQNVKTCEEYDKLMELRYSFIEKLGITQKVLSKGTFIIESIQPANSFSHSSTNHAIIGSGQWIMNSIMQHIAKMSEHNALKETNKLIRAHPEDASAIIRILSMMDLIQGYEFASSLVGKLKEMLSEDQYSEDGQSKFEVRPVDYALPIALALIGRLLIVTFFDLAQDLLIAISSALINDSAPLHMITNFTIRFRSSLQPRMVQILDDIVSKLPCADELYIKGNDLIFRIADMLSQKDMVLIQNPEIINREYKSPFIHALMFSQCALSLSPMTDDEIAHALCSPIYDMNRPWKNRETSCLVLSKLATTMNNEVSYRYFQIIMEKKINNMTLVAGRLFLMNCRIDVFKQICQSCQLLIRNDQIKLDCFIQMVMPSFTRIKGDESIATTLLCGFLESINENSPRQLQEIVVDVVGLVYTKLRLEKTRKAILNSANKFTPELKAIIITSLKLDPDILQGITSKIVR
ncbi:hypothetical protein TRFO_08249 [Tritrichomonas foetus]|uniref:Uncharacterized protein n=1 Tax=Tritrichomonas foetus TaxID=1144522 RepID=A0A1J4JQ31_9EUKA|nr:hypothetical protein TRFO_08249 [Tritrichomonas foetus]|eukprot:OHS99637.1 hypothetical protein TRFO_08249 [Tritrichomonas foetus]